MSGVCVQDQEAALQAIEDNLGKILLSTGDKGRRVVTEILEAAQKGIAEVQGHGLTMETCQEVSGLMLAAESHTRSLITEKVPAELLRLHVGLMMIHQTMQLVSLSEGMNEGPKDCEPWC